MVHNPCGHGPYIGQSRREKKDISIFTVWAGRWMQWPQNTNASVREISNRMGKGCNGRSSTRGCSRHQCTLRLDHIQRVLKNSCWLRESWVSFLSVQFSRSVLSNSLRPHGLQHARPPCQSPTPWNYSKVMSVEAVMPSNHLILCRPLLLLPSIFPSIRVFSSESLLPIRRPKC